MIKSLYNFEGGEQLTMLTVGWFVSYQYFENLDKKHRNWADETYCQRKTVIYNKSRKFHNIWLLKILCMPFIQVYPTLNLTEEQIKCMAKKILYKKLKENSVMATTPNIISYTQEPKQTFHINEKIDKCGRSPAIRFFSQMGYDINHNNCNYASKNTTTNLYWANPLTNRLKEDWYLILDDYKKRKLYLFYIPCNTFKAIPSYVLGDGITELKLKGENYDFLDLQINYGDPNFTDTRSHVKFNKFLVTSTVY